MRDSKDMEAEAEAKALEDLRGYQIRTWGRSRGWIRGRRLNYEKSKQRGDKIKDE